MTKFITVNGARGKRVVPINDNKSIGNINLHIVPSGMKNLKQAVLSKHNKWFKDAIKDIDTVEGLEKAMQKAVKQYRGTPEAIKNKFLKHMVTKRDKRIAEDILKITEVEGAKDFGGEFVVTLNWKKSRMWGTNPTAYTNYGFESESIGGCGYDKESTATALALNSHLPLLKMLYTKKDKNINQDNHKLLGYGSGYGIIPSFEGGVGVSSHQNVLAKVGLEMRNISSTPTSDVFVIKKASKDYLKRYK